MNQIIYIVPVSFLQYLNQLSYNLSFTINSIIMEKMRFEHKIFLRRASDSNGIHISERAD